MSDQPDIRSRRLPERVVLLALAQLERRDRTPARSYEIREVCDDHVKYLDGDVFGDVTERGIIRALNRLETTELVVQTEVEDPSATGKGRPCYSVDVDDERVLDELAAAEHTSELVGSIRGRFDG
jgi:hypothetical protein